MSSPGSFLSFALRIGLLGFAWNSQSIFFSPKWRISIESKANVMIPSSAWSHLNIILKHIKTPKKMQIEVIADTILAEVSDKTWQFGTFDAVCLSSNWRSVGSTQSHHGTCTRSCVLLFMLGIKVSGRDQWIPVEILWNPMKSYEIPRDSCWILLVWGVIN